MEQLIVIIVGAVVMCGVCGVIYFLYSESKKRFTDDLEGLQSEIEDKNLQLREKQTLLDEAQSQLNELKTDYGRLQATYDAERSKVSERDVKISVVEADLKELRFQDDKLKQELQESKTAEEGARVKTIEISRATDELNKNYKALEARYCVEHDRRVEADQKNEKLKTRMEEQQLHNTKALKQLEENKEQLKQEFENLANEIFEKKGKVFTDQNKVKLDEALNPFKEQLKEFKDKVESARKEDSEGRVKISEQLKNLHSLNKQITDEAKNLTTALKGDKKLQGCWGEMQVEKILEASGLVANQEYTREENFKDNDGKNVRPDFVIKLPNNKQLIVDSKVSLVNYLEYVQAEDVEEQDVALKKHIDCIKKHINGLHSKDYSQLPGVETPDFVFMFLPIEPSFTCAFQKEPELYNTAFENNIIVVTPSTLLASLRTVANLWTIERQNSKSKELAKLASQVYDKLRLFTERMSEVGKFIDKARDKHDEAYKGLCTGNGNLIRTAERFKGLGVRVKKELPRDIVEQAGGNELVIDVHSLDESLEEARELSEY